MDAWPWIMEFCSNLLLCLRIRPVRLFLFRQSFFVAIIFGLFLFFGRRTWTQHNDSESPDISFGLDEFGFDLLYFTSDLQSKASSKPEYSSASDAESESSELMMYFGLWKFQLIVDLLLLVRCNFSLLLLLLNDANKSFEQLLEELFLFLIEESLNVIPVFAGE